MSKGLVIIDKNGAVILRVGSNTAILPITAMTIFNNKCVVGCGSDNGTQGNLHYFDKDRYQEKGNIVGGTADDNTITSVHYSKNFGAEKVSQQQRLTMMTVLYYDDENYADFSFTLDCRIDDGNTLDWTKIGNFALGQATGIVSINIMETPKQLGNFFQFRITSDYKFEIIGYQPFFSYESIRQL